ncbi:cytochrome P450 [Kineosporia sp. J2-2]|uniref:Cytochrome P450 n=1 Tax=Kineosporia corallincola TaxID=2835133 RepID=A0ABS5TEM9_9ACTN|nr:cytochrome P450 [Kineosporia corallincola]MBT0769313.1 cytochrome P450 [Kineosporia corallincola]
MSSAPTPPFSPRRNAKYTILDADGPLPLDMIRGVPAIMRNPLAWLERVVDRHGDLVAFPMPTSSVLLVNTPAGARHVLQRNHRNYSKATIQYGALSLVTGSGLLTSDGEVWRRHRRTLQPAFHHGGLDQVAVSTVAAGEQLRAAWDRVPPYAPIDAEAAIMQAMLTVVGRTLFADDLSSAGEELVHAVDRALRQVIARATNPLAVGPLSRLPTPSALRMRSAVATLDRITADIVARRRAQGVGEDDADLLAVLLRAGADESGAAWMTEREIRDELVTLVIAGHETVASSLVWTLHLLADAPQVQERLYAELDQVLAGRPPAWGDVPALRYTRAVVDEALRLYPPAWVITRRATGPDTVDGVDVPEGTLIIVSPWLLHRSAANWPEPERFDPERFLGVDRNPAYLPFGAGPRLCIGRDFALVESVLLLATLLRDRAVRRPAGVRPPRLEALVTLRPKRGLPMALVPRIPS